MDPFLRAGRYIFQVHSLYDYCHMKPFRAKARRAKQQPNYRLDDTLHKRSDTDYSFNQTSKPCVEDWLWSRREMERYDGFIYQQHKEMKVKNVINPGTDCRQQ